LPNKKHSPNKLSSYLDIHETVMQKYLDDGFVLSNALSLEDLKDLVIMSGTIRCLGGISIDVFKSIKLLNRDGANTLVVRDTYSYNVYLKNAGNIFRYCSPHEEHNKGHHVHRYNVLSGDKKGSLDFIDEDNTPTLGQVIEESRRWYYDNYSSLESGIHS
jgi:hypothetical protein